MMTKNPPRRTAVNQDAAVIRALSSITLDQADKLTEIIRSAEPVWDVQTFDDYDGYLSLHLTPVIQSESEKSFSITGKAECLELWEAHEDNLTPIGSFDSVDQLSARLMELIGK